MLSRSSICLRYSFCLSLIIAVSGLSSTALAADAKASAGSADGSKQENQIVAVVNGQPISRQELARLCVERYGNTVLESLVNKHLILQACKQREITITRQDIENEIDRIASSFSLPKEQWLSMLEQERQIAPQQYRRDIIWPTLALKRLAVDKLTVTEAQLSNAFEREYGEKVQVRMIAVSGKQKADQLRAKAVASPENFGKLAKQYSEDPNSAAARGLIPPIRKHMGEPEIERIAFALQPNEISEVIHIANQHIILKCERHLPAANISPQYREAAEDRLKRQIVDENLRKASGEIFQQLQADATVVNVWNNEKLRAKYPGVAARINNQQLMLKQLAEECVVRHGADVLDKEINRQLLKQALKKAGQKVTQQELTQEVARAAEAYGYVNSDNKPDVERWLKEVTSQEEMDVQSYVRDAVWPTVALKKLVASDVEVTQEDLEKGFEANYGPRVEVKAIVLSNQRIAQEVWDMARANLSPTFFGELASQYSIEPVSRANMGEVPPIRRFSGQPGVEDEAFSLSADDPLSAIVAIADKYIIMYYVGRTTPVVEQLADVRDELQKDIHEKKLRIAMSQQFDLIRDTAQIDNFLRKTSQAGKQVDPDAVGANATPATPRAARSNPRLIRNASRRTRK